MHETFDTEQSERLSLFRSVAFKGPAIKRVLGNVGMNNPNPAALPMIGGVAKVFVAEMVEKAREIQKAKGETGALAPEHLREAYRQYSEEYGRVGPAQPMKGKLRFVR
ncbi:histone-fold-containing protein [Clavulina sp. PMI_390]|nr:histone-fold-containing protein [Clavulina sp. PMI_390]